MLAFFDVWIFSKSMKLSSVHIHYSLQKFVSNSEVCFEFFGNGFLLREKRTSLMPQFHTRKPRVILSFTVCILSLPFQSASLLLQRASSNFNGTQAPNFGNGHFLTRDQLHPCWNNETFSKQLVVYGISL